MLTWLTPELDQDIRAYARYLSPDNGEDGYHDAIVSLLVYHGAYQPHKPKAFMRTATKRRVQQVWRNEAVYRQQMQSYMAGEGSSYYKNLQAGRQPHKFCKRGHALTPDNIVYRGGNVSRRLCKQCVNELKQKGKHP